MDYEWQKWAIGVSVVVLSLFGLIHLGQLIGYSGFGEAIASGMMGRQVLEVVELD